MLYNRLIVLTLFVTILTPTYSVRMSHLSDTNIPFPDTSLNNALKNSIKKENIIKKENNMLWKTLATKAKDVIIWIRNNTIPQTNNIGFPWQEFYLGIWLHNTMHQPYNIDFPWQEYYDIRNI